MEKIKDFFKAFLLVELLKGMALTGRYMFARKITVQFPEEKTPQSFRYGLIHAAYLAAETEGFLGTDDASLMERQGWQLRIVMGDYRNLKITTPEDMVLAQALLKDR